MPYIYLQQKKHLICINQHRIVSATNFFLSKISFIDRFFQWLFNRTYKRSRKIMKYGAIGLTLFVAIPLPITGAWTGSIAAILFNIKS